MRFQIVQFTFEDTLYYSPVLKMPKTNDYLVPPHTKVKLSDYDPDDTAKFRSKEHAEAVLRKHQEKLFELQELLYADTSHSLLVVLQGLDAAGKDGTIGHIFSGVNPQGCQVTSFKEPTPEELRHDFLWRVHRAVPARGMIGIFNRSHYEDVLVVRVHGKLSKKELSNRFDEINSFEENLARNNVLILKFFLYISKDEQKKRLQERLDDPKKYWKVSPTDLKERQYWDTYIEAYEDVFRHCSTKRAPWYIIPANKKWYRNVVISQVLVDALAGLQLKYPKPQFDIPGLKLS
ncbi:MAG TPA: polyphosphate kinase 2 family protein [Terriglobales bacterium]|nr:polyphosphate kinase 2 family protein [Terriglobales bacterium]